MDAVKKMLSQLGKATKQKVTSALQEKVLFSAWDYLKAGEPDFAIGILQNLGENLSGVDAIAVKQCARDLAAEPQKGESPETIASWIADLQDRVATLEAGGKQAVKKAVAKAEKAD